MSTSIIAQFGKDSTMILIFLLSKTEGFFKIYLLLTIHIYKSTCCIFNLSGCFERALNKQIDIVYSQPSLPTAPCPRLGQLAEDLREGLFAAAGCHSTTTAAAHSFLYNIYINVHVI